jgi:hypothetical protein
MSQIVGVRPVSQLRCPRGVGLFGGVGDDKGVIFGQGAAGAPVITPSGEFFYAENLFVNSSGAHALEVVAYEVNTDGSLAQLSQPPFAGSP